MLILGFGLALIIGLSLGLLGGGGSILTVPLLVYVLGTEPHQAIAVSLFVVGLTSGIGALQHAKKGNVKGGVGMLFAVGGMVGAFLGGILGGFIPGGVLLILFALMMLATSIAMLRKKSEEEEHPKTVLGSKWFILFEGLLVGVFTGMVGAGGGFLVVPALVLFAGLPVRHAVGTSLMVISLKSFTGLLGYLNTVDIDWMVAGVIAAGAVLGSFPGTYLAHRVTPDKLRKGFAWFVLAMGIFVLVKELL